MASPCQGIIGLHLGASIGRHSHLLGAKEGAKRATVQQQGLYAIYLTLENQRRSKDWIMEAGAKYSFETFTMGESPTESATNLGDIIG